MKRNIAILTLCVLSTQGLCAAQVSTSEKELKTFSYDAAKTSQLQEIYDNPPYTYDYGNEYREGSHVRPGTLFKENRWAMQQLIEEGANPNIRRGSQPLLCDAVSYSCFELTQCCLQYGANPNVGCHITKIPPLYLATSVRIAECLLNHNADLLQPYGDRNLLHEAAICNRVPELFSFFCSAGINPNQGSQWGSTPLHTLLNRCKYSTNIKLKVAVLVWAGADINSRNNQGLTPLNILQQEFPTLVPQVQAIAAIIPIIKAEQREAYKKILMDVVSRGPAGLVMDYVGEEKPLWHDSYWPLICDRMPQATASAPSWPSCLLQ